MPGKTLLILAPVIVGSAVLFVVFWVGTLCERWRAERLADYINPKVHHDLVEMLRRIVAPPADLDEVIVLPEAMRVDATTLVVRAQDNLERVRARQRFRDGYR